MTQFSLPDSMARCLAHDNKPGTFLPCGKTCSRSLQIGRDARPSTNVLINACRFDTRLPLFVPADGFPPEDIQ